MKIINTNTEIDIENRKITMTVLAHRSTKFQYIDAHVTKSFQKSNEIRKTWNSVGNPVIINNGRGEEMKTDIPEFYKYNYIFTF